MAGRARVPQGYSAWAARPRPRGIPEPGSDAWAALAAMAGCLAGGTRQLTAAKFRGSSREGGVEPSRRPPVRAGPASPGASPTRRDGARRWDGADGSAGLPTREICRSCLQLSAAGAFRAVTQTPPSSPHTPPAPYAACALTQRVGLGRCHLLCHTQQDMKPGRGRGRQTQSKTPSGTDAREKYGARARSWAAQGS